MTKLDGLSTRGGAPPDYPVFVELFRAISADDPVPGRERWESTLAGESLMVVHEGRVIAFSNVERFPDRAHVHLVAVLPEYRQKRVGSFLMQAVRDELARAGFSRFFLHVYETNQAAIRLYESIGMARVGASVGMRIHWDRLARRGPSSDEVQSELVTPERDAELERAFSLIPTRLSLARKRGRIVLGAFSGGEAQGLLVHDPTLVAPTALRVTRPELLPALLGGLLPYEAARDSINVLVDDHPEAEAFLTALGASVLYRSYRYEGVP